MSNITMAIDEKLLKKARMVALEKGTTVSSMVRRFLETVVSRKNKSKEKLVKDLKELYTHSQVSIGPRIWKREDLYER